MERVFFKSALPAGDSRLLEDSSLALPAPRSRGAADGPPPEERGLRLRRQVQLTLARRAKRSPAGDGSLQKNASRSCNASDGLEVNGFFGDSSASGKHLLQKPFRRVEVSPPSSPDTASNRFSYNRRLFATHTLPSPRSSHWNVQEFTFGPDSYRHYAFSEAPRDRRLHASASTNESFHLRGLGRTAWQQAAFGDPGFQRSGGEFRVGWTAQNQTVSRERRRTAQGQSGFGTYATFQPFDRRPWVARVGGDGQILRRLNSYPPLGVNVEENASVTTEPELHVQQIQAAHVATPKSESKPPEMTLERAVNMLTHGNEESLISAAAHIQSQCFKSKDAKKMVYFLRGIRKLLQLLDSDEEEVQRAAAGALRNVVYESNENKMEVTEGDGLAMVLGALKSSRDVETRRQLTGLLWNLSSHDLLKNSLIREALPALTQSVLVPCSGISEGENPKDELLADDEVFHSASGCLRNLSSAGPDGRRAMRECENLLDSLVYYIRTTISDYKTDDKSTENCVCILHNLSYQIDSELPAEYRRDQRDSRQDLAPKAKTLGCFAYRGAKIPEQVEHQCTLLEEKANPRGIEWLWSSITIRMYLSLIARSVRHCTQEAALGALQNITAGNGAMSEAIAYAIVQRENGLQHVKTMLLEGEDDVKRTAVFLVKNFSCHKELHPEIVLQVLPEVVEMLPDGGGGDRPCPPEAVTAALCQILINLSQSDAQNVRAIVSQGALPGIIAVSGKDAGYGTSRAAQTASLLLHVMWKHTELHGFYKKWGYRKSDFVNARTIKAVNSSRD